MLNLEIIGNEDTIAAVKRQMAPITGSDIRQYHHKGASGEAGVFGLVTSLSKSVLPPVLDILRFAVPRDRNLKVNINGLELVVRNVGEASEVLDLLEDRGLLPKDEDGEP